MPRDHQVGKRFNATLFVVFVVLAVGFAMLIGGHFFGVNAVHYTGMALVMLGLLALLILVAVGFYIEQIKD